MLLDGALISSALFLSLVLRFDAAIPVQYKLAFHHLLPYCIVLNIVFLYFFKLYHRIWRYASVNELYGLLKAITVGMALFVVVVYTFNLPTLPRSVYIMSWFLSLMLVGASRLGLRILREFFWAHKGEKASKRVLVIGAGDAGSMVVKELFNNPKLKMTPIGFIDDDIQKQKLIMHGVPVLGRRKDIPEVVRKHNIAEAIIAMPSAGGKVIRSIYEVCKQTGLEKIHIFQGVGGFLSGKYHIKNIEVEDLLKREPVKLNLDEIARYIAEKVVLVSGAGGSIGSELCRQIGLHSPDKMVLLDCSENNLFEIENEIKDKFPDLTVVSELADIKGKERMLAVFEKHKPNVVFHAAAYKHVPMMEKHPLEAIRNNIFGTCNIAEAADRFNAETFILISTDKAVNPSNVMGATKRIAELIVKEMNARSRTIFAAVRFGNVLGSRGSVVPIFKKQIESGGPVTVTHPGMTRYFMTIPEAAQLVIQAGAMAKGGEIFILDMGDPVKIMDLANDMIRLMGYEPEKDIEIKIIGPRPGEKLYEELFTSREQIAATLHDRIFVFVDDAVYPVLDNIKQLESVPIADSDAKRIIRNLLPELESSKIEEVV